MTQRAPTVEGAGRSRDGSTSHGPPSGGFEGGDEGGSSITRRRRAVVVVSNDPALASFVALALRRRGCDVTCVATARQARAAIRDVLPVLVIVHVPLVDESGIGLISMSRRDLGARTIALVDAGITIESADVDVQLGAADHVMAVVNAARDLVGLPGGGGGAAGEGDGA